MLLSTLNTLKPVTIKFNDRANAQITRFLDVSTFCSTNPTYCRIGSWIEVGVVFCLKGDSEPFV